MTTLTGYLVPSAFHEHSDNRAVWFAAPIPKNTPDAKLGSGAKSGARTNTQPINEIPITRTGHGAFDAGYGGIFYNRIQITPSNIDVGKLITAKTIPVELWNAFLVSKSVTALSSANDEGVGLNAPIAIPSTLGPLQYTTYAVTVTTNGPPEINAAFSWTIAGNAYPLGVIGSRVVIFPFLANWTSTVREDLSWLTGVETSYSGDEQRTRWRDAGRKELTYATLIKGKKATAKLENIMFGWQSRSFAVPIVTERALLVASAPVGSTVLSVHTTNIGVYAGQPLILTDGADLYEAVEVLSVSALSITLLRPTVNAWPEGTYAYPAGIAQMAAQQVLQRETNTHATASFTWRFNVGDAMANTSSEAAPVTYRGNEVYLKKSDWSRPPSFTFVDAYDTFGDNGSGLLEFDQTADWPTIIVQRRYVFKNRAEIVAFRKFLGRRAGRWSPCWIPTGNDDFIIAANVNTADSVITVEDNQYRLFVNGHAARRTIAIFLRGVDTPVMCSIDRAEDIGGGKVNLVLDALVGTTFAKESVVRICHMNLYRLASDITTLDWETDSVLTTQINWQLVKA